MYWLCYCLVSCILCQCNRVYWYLIWNEIWHNDIYRFCYEGWVPYDFHCHCWEQTQVKSTCAKLLYLTSHLQSHVVLTDRESVTSPLQLLQTGQQSTAMVVMQNKRLTWGHTWSSVKYIWEQKMVPCLAAWKPGPLQPLARLQPAMLRVGPLLRERWGISIFDISMKCIGWLEKMLLEISWALFTFSAEFFSALAEIQPGPHLKFLTHMLFTVKPIVRDLQTVYGEMLQYSSTAVVSTEQNQFCEPYPTYICYSHQFFYIIRIFAFISEGRV